MAWYRFSQIILLILTLCRLSAGWVVPHDLPDGIFDITFPDDNDGGTTQPTIVKRDGYPSVKDTWDKNNTRNMAKGRLRLSARRLPAVKPPFDLPKPADNGDDGELTLPIDNFDCIYNEPLIPREDLAQARAFLFQYCSRFLVQEGAAHVAVAKTGDAVAYVCSWGEGNQPCSRREYEQVEVQILNFRCGARAPGWARSSKYKRTYGRGWVGGDICTINVMRKEIVDKNVWVGPLPEWAGKKAEAKGPNQGPGLEKGGEWSEMEDRRRES